MKNLLAENMLRFGTKNLTESTKQRLIEATAMSGSLPVTKERPLPVTKPLPKPLTVIPLSKPETIIANQEDQTINTNTQSSVLQNLQLQSDNIQSQIESIQSIQDEQKQLRKLQQVTMQIEELKKQISTECKQKAFKGKLCRLYQKQLLTLQTQKLATDGFSRSGGGGGNGGGDGDGANKITNWTIALGGVLSLITSVMLAFKKDDKTTTDADADAGTGDN
jgi:TolA-binding protein